MDCPEFYQVFRDEDLRDIILSIKRGRKTKNIVRWRGEIQEKHRRISKNKHCENSEKIRHMYALGGSDMNWRYTAALLGLYYMIEDEE
tara:strand:- start:233 stop:496 length:264 start_codon:yes stop_codon:yes gene_type:complete